ncbi:hypothetical protein CTAYLR_001380 [Chrysophaeum taylorii]|uniref:Uncharacterized protein n=1 Tax=Chrysophaeum taylorii TaxID=2483200 RepID=A0AAD7U5C1_9STRA|nr:hypothetical protein CTAYLR_001380 [Chrysophaeum taylorii]
MATSKPPADCSRPTSVRSTTKENCLLTRRAAVVTSRSCAFWLSTAPTSISLNGRVEVARVLVEHGADVNKVGDDGSSPLHFASLNGRVEVARVLVEHGADVNKVGDDGSSPLHFASWTGFFDVVRILVERGADVNLANKYGHSPLHIASSTGIFDVVRTLLEDGDDVNLADEEPPPAFYDVVRLFLEHGADANLAGNDGCSPLFAVCRRGFVGLACLLLEHGADVEQVDNYGRSPIQVASENGRVDVVRLLVEHGANHERNISFSALPIARRKGFVGVQSDLIENGTNLHEIGKGGNSLVNDAMIRETHESEVNDLRGKIDRLETELKRWRSGDLVSVRVLDVDTGESTTTTVLDTTQPPQKSSSSSSDLEPSAKAARLMTTEKSALSALSLC